MSIVSEAISRFNRGSDPLTVIRVTEQEPINLHAHEFHELVVIIRGEGTHFTAREKYVIRQGDVFLVKPGLDHGYTVTRDLHLVNILYFPDRMSWSDLDVKDMPGYKAFFSLEPALRQQHEFKSRLNLSPGRLEKLERLIIAMETELLHAEPGRIQMAMAWFMQIKGYIARSYATHHTPYTLPLLRVGELMGFLEQNHHRRDLTLDSMAARVAMARSTLNRVFNKTLGMSPVNYLISIRLRHAARLLRETDTPVTDIAYQTGFSDSNFFSRQFKRAYQVPPREFRKNTGLQTAILPE